MLSPTETVIFLDGKRQKYVKQFSMKMNADTAIINGEIINQEIESGTLETIDVMVISLHADGDNMIARCLRY